MFEFGKKVITVEPDENGFYTEMDIRNAKFALSYSTLKATIDDPISLVAGKKDLNSHTGVIFGSIVDKMLFDGPESLKDDFAIVDSFKIPTSNSLAIADEMIKQCTEEGSEKKPGAELFLSCARDLKLFEKNKDEVITKKYTADTQAYCNAKIISASGKKFITKDDFEKAERAVEVLRTHEYTKPYLDQGREGLEVFYQVGLIEDYGKNKIKGVYDIFIIDHNRKIILPMDLKTTAFKGRDFKRAFIEYNYALQAELYNFMAKSFAERNFPGYEVVDFRYMVLSSRDIENPFIFKFDEEVYKSKYVPRYNLKTLSDYIHEYQFISTNQEFNYPSEHVEKGFIELYV